MDIAGMAGAWYLLLAAKKMKPYDYKTLKGVSYKNK